MSRRLSDIPEDELGHEPAIEPAQHEPAIEPAPPITTDPPKRKRHSRKSEVRREYEFAEFIHVDYMWFIKTVERKDVETIEVALQDGRKAVVKRSLDWLQPPGIWLNGQRIAGYDAEFSPALTSIRWLMMIAIA